MFFMRIEILQAYGKLSETHVTLTKMTKEEFLKDLEGPESAILYSLEPSIPNDTIGFHGFKVLGEVKLAPSQIAIATLEFKEAVEAFNDNMAVAACFNPRVGLRVVKDGKTSDFALCFECRGMVGYSSDGTQFHYEVAGSPQNLNQILLDAKIPISKIEE